MTSLYDGPIVDAHHHLWELGSGRYSWLTDGPRDAVFGSTGPLIRDYLLADYLADMAGIDLVKSVHIQASFSTTRRPRPAGCKASPTSTAFPTGSSPTPASRSRTPKRCWKPTRSTATCVASVRS